MRALLRSEFHPYAGHYWMTRLAEAELTELLHSTFGFSDFRGRQRDVIERVMAGAHACAIMPTGAGKSLCYQLPALARRGTAIVVSPLIALMHDQIRSAHAVGIRAASMTSADTDNAATAQALRNGELDLLYVAPERANTPAFRSLLGSVEIALFAIDEAHCVSEWGHDFRPDYRQLRPMLDAFPDVPRLALTATADETTRRDILFQLGIDDEGLIVAGFDRPNIHYSISAEGGGAAKITQLASRLQGSGIVYVQSRAGTEALAARIAQTGRTAAAYHAGLPTEDRARVQAEFVRSEDMVIVATIAFGMGIDKPDVRFVIHAGLPKSLEAYYQETGRAGRDGDPATAHLFWSASDFAKARMRIEEVEPERRASERGRLNALAGLVETAGCRRAVLLRHFGEAPPATCGNCDNCDDPPRVIDATEVARKLLSAVYRTGQSFGIGHIEKVLRGREDDRVIQRGHDRLSVFGILDDNEATLLRPAMRSLLAHARLVGTDHGGLALGEGAREILRGDEAVLIAEPPQKRARHRSARVSNPVGDPLFDALRERRKSLASERGIPAYVVFHDSVLRAMASEKPRDLDGLAALQGVGVKKLETYGEEFCEVIREFVEA